MREPKYDVYRLEVFERTYSTTISGGPDGRSVPIQFGGRLLLDVVIPDFDVLRTNVYDAMMYGCDYLCITHLGVRRMVTTCAQFEDEYGRGKGN